MQYYVQAIDNNSIPKVEISDAIRWAKLSLDEVTHATITNCWQHTGILPVNNTITKGDSENGSHQEIETNSGALLYREFGNVFECLHVLVPFE